MIWHVKCVLTCLLLNLYFFIGDRYSTCLFTGVHQCTKRTTHPSMHILDHSQGAFMFEEKILCLYSLYRMNRKRYLYVVTSIFPPDAIRISR